MTDLENKAVTHLTVSVDSSTRNNPPYIYAKRNDANSRYLVVKIIDKNKEIAVTGAAQLNATKPDGKHSHIAGNLNSDGTITIGLTSNLLAVEGKVSCDITVFDSKDGEQSSLTTSTFFIIVDDTNFDPESIESTDEFSTITEALVQIAEDRAATERARDETISVADSIPIPYVGENGHWFIGIIDTGVKAQGEQGDPGFTPHIGENGHWFVGEVDTGVEAQGEQGEQGIQGEKGEKGNINYATFELSVEDGCLHMYTTDEYTGPQFVISEDGDLEVVING